MAQDQIVTDRTQELLTDVAGHFQGRTKILDMRWIVEKDVQPAELEDLSALAAGVLRGFLTLPEEDQAALVFAGRNSGLAMRPLPKKHFA